MGFLDDVLVNWTNPDTLWLRDLLAQAYPDTSAAFFIAQQAGYPPSAFPAASPDAQQLWTELMSNSAKLGLLRTLVQTVVADPDSALFRPSFSELLRASDGRTQETRELTGSAGNHRVVL